MSTDIKIDNVADVVVEDFYDVGEPVKFITINTYSGQRFNIELHGNRGEPLIALHRTHWSVRDEVKS